MDPKKQILLNSIVSFLNDELSSNAIDEDKKESIEVAVQCLETAFNMENHKVTDKVDLLSLIPVDKKVDVTDEQKAQAEQHKNAGNNYMKNSQYDLAISEYTSAIKLNPYNAVYYCNRAAAYTRLLKDREAIDDCKEAINLDPSYGKAYGRLGIAYSNLNKYDLALKAYETALKYDPNNSMYETNLNVAKERLQSSAGGATPNDATARLPGNLSEFINNPNIINMASQVLSDSNFHSMMSALINNVSSENNAGMPGAVETMLQAGQALAQRVVNEDPDFYNRVVRNVQAGTQPPPNTDNSQGSNDKPPEKDNESA